MNLYYYVTSLFLLLFFSLPFLSFAQQSSKTKAANKLYEKGGEVEVINATKLNSKGLDFSPAYYQNGIVFASSRYKNGVKDKKINETYFELFYAEAHWLLESFLCYLVPIPVLE